MRVSTLRCLVASMLCCATLISTAQAQAPAEATAPAAPAAPAQKPPPTKLLASNTEATEEETKKFLANPIDVSAPVTSLAVWDASVDVIANSAAYARQQAAPRPQVGPRMTAAWDKYVLAPDAKAQLDTLRQRATKEAEAKNEKAVERSVAEASKLIIDQRFRFNAVAAYVNASDALELQRQLLAPWVERGSDADRTKADNLLTTGETALAGALEEVIKAKKYDGAALNKVRSAAAPTLRELNAHRVALAQGPIFTANPVPLAAISRETACPAAIAGAEGKEKPTLGPDFPSADEYYPPEAKAASIEGAVNVRVVISETGCVTQAAVAATSGASNLDVAALQLAMAGTYRPGLRVASPWPATWFSASDSNCEIETHRARSTVQRNFPTTHLRDHLPPRRGQDHAHREAAALFGGAIQMAGTVKGRKAARHATSDWMRLEQQRGISVTSSVMQFPYRDAIVNLLDTPGHEDFSEDTYRTLTAVDSALMVIDCAKGVEERTIKLMEVTRLRNTPIMTFINKLDREGRAPIELLDEVEQVLKIRTAPITWPIGMGSRLKGIYHLLEDRIYAYEAGRGGRVGENLIIDKLQSPEAQEFLGDMAKEFADEIELVKGATEEFNPDEYRAAKQTPVFFGSAISNFGVEELLTVVHDARARTAAARHARSRCRAAGRKAHRFRVQDPGEHGSRSSRPHCLHASVLEPV